MSISSGVALYTTEITERRIREHRSVFPAEVTKVQAVAPHLLRFTLTAPEFCSLKLMSPDEYFGLFMTRQDQTFEHLPTACSGNIRQHTAFLPAKRRPDLRWYTVRHFDQNQRKLSFDIATHGVTLDDLRTPGGTAIDVGPGLRWALHTQPGDKVNFYPAQGLWYHQPYPQLLVGDASSAPSIRSILEFLRDYHPGSLHGTHVIMAAESEHDLEPGYQEEWLNSVASLRIVWTPITEQAYAVQNELVQARKNKHPLSQVRYMWACGEQQLARLCRHEAVKEWGLDSKYVTWSPYWIMGKPRP